MTQILLTFEKTPTVSVSLVWYCSDKVFRPLRRNFYALVHKTTEDPILIIGRAHLNVRRFKTVTYYTALKRFKELVSTPMNFEKSTFKPWIL